jgi:peptidoglycan hydrolase CwlO-like protein
MCENPEVTIVPAKKKIMHKDTNATATTECTINAEAEIKRLQNELNLANNKVTELTKIVESMKGQSSQLEQMLNNEKIKNQATKEYMLDAAKHLYISMTMAAKGGV